jgi:NAD(P)-dependent dehydrogenase (short-subunit alcohol dehydrogenase family)
MLPAASVNGAVLVTGASSGIGAGLAEAFARAGATVGMCARRADRLAETAERCRALGATVHKWTVDLAEPAQVDGLARSALADMGGVDILVNNAGIATTELVEDLDEAQWRRVLDVNLTGPFLCAKAVLPHMRARGWGRIVNVASVAARRISFTAAASYTASKAGLLGFTRHLAYEVAPDGINVNAICPGPTLTPMYERNTDEATRGRRISLVPKGRWIMPSDHGGIVVFLCTSAADSLCGVALDVDGGSLLGWMPWEEYMARRKRR